MNAAITANVQSAAMKDSARLMRASAGWPRADRAAEIGAVGGVPAFAETLGAEVGSGIAHALPAELSIAQRQLVVDDHQRVAGLGDGLLHGLVTFGPQDTHPLL